MKRSLFVLVALLAGCVVRSFHPFCTDKALVFPADVIGEWTLLKDSGDDVSTNNIQPWVIAGTAATNTTLVSYDKNHLGAKFAARFFTLGDDRFLDVLPLELGEGAKVNDYWWSTVQRVHAVCKVETNGDLLLLKLLDYDWLKENLEKHRVTLPYLGKLDEIVLFTATPQQWEPFLRKYARDAEAFPDEHAFVLKRRPAK